MSPMNYVEAYDLATLASNEKHRRAFRVVCLLILSAYFPPKRQALDIRDIALTLGLDKAHRRTWGRTCKLIRAQKFGSLFRAPNSTTGKWWMKFDPTVKWHINQQPLEESQLKAFIDLDDQDADMAEGSPTNSQQLTPEMCELIGSQERRFRSGAFDKALAASTELESLIPGYLSPELLVATKRRKLRILNRIQRWEELETEVAEIAKLSKEPQLPQVARDELDCLQKLYSSWLRYNDARKNATQHRETYFALHGVLSSLTAKVQRNNSGHKIIDCEIKSLLILVRRRLLCESFPEPEPTLLDIRLKKIWVEECKTWSAQIIAEAAIMGDLEMISNYAGNYGYLLASFHDKSLLYENYSIQEAFRWMLVSDRIAARIDAGSDNLWNPIYWLYLRRVCISTPWAEMIGWMRPVTKGHVQSGPKLPYPGNHASCFDFAVWSALRVLNAPTKYISSDQQASTQIPQHQIQMLLNELEKMSLLENISDQTKTGSLDAVKRFSKGLR